MLNMTSIDALDAQIVLALDDDPEATTLRSPSPRAQGRMIATWLSFALITAYDCSCAKCVAPLTSDPQGLCPQGLEPQCVRGGLELSAAGGTRVRPQSSKRALSFQYS